MCTHKYHLSSSFKGIGYHALADHDNEVFDYSETCPFRNMFALKKEMVVRPKAACQKIAPTRNKMFRSTR